MSDAESDLERVKGLAYDGREAIREARLILEDRELDEKRAKIKQHLYDAEDYAGLALHLIDPELVS